jgi:5'-nucleotidase
VDGSAGRSRLRRSTGRAASAWVFPPAMPSPLVLLANDDGYASPGIRAMRAALMAAGADVIVLAPESEQSASSHALSLHRPMRLREVEAGVFALDGTPADCVYVALHAGTRVLPKRPDLVVSGINNGMNLGQDAFYSGTIAAAREGALRGIPAVAASAHSSLPLPPVADLGARLALELLRDTRARASTALRGPLVSLNVPERWNGDLRATRLGARIYDEVVDFRRDPRGREYLWLGGPGVRHERDAGTDTDAYDDGAASITPLILDMTSPGEAAAMTSLAERTVARTVDRA